MEPNGVLHLGPRVSGLESGTGMPTAPRSSGSSTRALFLHLPSCRLFVCFCLFLFVWFLVLLGTMVQKTPDAVVSAIKTANKSNLIAYSPSKSLIAQLISTYFWSNTHRQDREHINRDRVGGKGQSCMVS